MNKEQAAEVLRQVLLKPGAPRCPECKREWTTFGHRDECSLGAATEPKP